MLKILREGSGENDAISLLAECSVDRSNAKSFERCEMFSGCTTKARCTPNDIIDLE